MKALQKVRINRQNAILVIVDMQNEFCKPGGKLYTETNARIMPGVISAIQGLAGQARSAGIPIIYIQGVRTLREPEFTVFGMEPHIQIGTKAVEIIEELKPEKEDAVIQKFCHDPFYQPDLDRVLQKLVPDPTRCCAVVTGGAINICVYHIVMGFHLRNYWTVVPVDSVFYMNEPDKGIALEQFSHQAYPNIFLSRSDLIEVSKTSTAIRPVLTPVDPA